MKKKETETKTTTTKKTMRKDVKSNNRRQNVSQTSRSASLKKIMTGLALNIIRNVSYLAKKAAAAEAWAADPRIPLTL